MDSFTFNKIAGAVLSALLVIFGGGTLIGELYPDGKGKDFKEIQIVEVAAVEEAPKAEAAPAEAAPIAQLLASASVETGENAFKRCSACHSVNKGGANGIGPNLYGVVGRPLGAVEGFSYSGALKEKGGAWDYEALNGFLLNPKGWAPGTKMAFGGIRRDDERAAVIAYLRSLADEPQPLPTQ
ncbi:MAG: cytochrome c family protein [Hyphomicrobiales bacterium]|nr:cytochrome c family protein [Hyphomicrobiales bacterium]